MAYTNSIPFAAQRFKDSQPLILDNFIDIQNALIVNHGDFNTPDVGKHNFLTMPRQAVVPTPPFAATEIAVYNILNATSGISELYVQKGIGTGIPFTLSQNGGVSGWTYLPSGMKMVWGQDTIAGGVSTKTTLFSSVATFPGFSTSALGIQITRMHNATSNNFIQLDSFTNLQFIARRSTSTLGTPNLYTWLAIGL